MEIEVLPVMRNSAEHREGRRRLKQAMGKARAEARKQDTELRLQSILGMSIMEILQEKHFDALVVYQDGPGRWFGDLMLKGMPTGMPEALGTPQDMPRESKSEALNDAFLVLVAALVGIEEQRKGLRDTKVQDRRVFVLNDVSFSLPGDVVDETARKVYSMNAPEEVGRAVGHDMIKEAVALISGDGDFNEAAYDAAPEDIRSILLTGMGILLAYGEFRLDL